MLIDAYYGAWSCVATGAIGPQTGLLVRVEMSGSPKNKVGAPLGLIEPGWSVEKIKLIGADAVKLLAQYEPTEPQSAEHQFQLIEHVYSECKKHDILMLLETVAFPFGGEKKTDPSFINRKAATVIDSARQLSRFCDVYKAEFPGNLGHDSDKQLRDNLQALNASSERPWVLLSAGVDYADYYKQVQMALEAGASGVLGGRAFWKEYFLQDGAPARSQFAATTALKRVADVNTLVRERRHALVGPLRSQQREPGFNPRHRRLACPLWLAAWARPSSGTPVQASPGRSLLSRRLPDVRHVRQPTLWENANAQRLARFARTLLRQRSRRCPPQVPLLSKNLHRAQPRPDPRMQSRGIHENGPVNHQLARPVHHESRR